MYHLGCMVLRDETSIVAPSLTLLGVPSSAGARRTGQEGAPAALRAAGIVERLRAKGLDVSDLGDQPSVSFRPDPGHPRQQNLVLVVDVAQLVADRIDRALADRALALVLGGDCTVTLGVVAGLLRHRERLGLLYCDADLDLETPETTPSGVFDGMVLAHLLGRGEPRLAGIGPRRPMLSDEDVVLFGYNVDSGWVDPPELEALERSRLTRFPLSRLQRGAAAAAREAVHVLEARSDAIVVHFDVDVMEFAAADVPHPGGLDPESALAALKVFVASPACAAVVVTEFNAERDPDGAHAGRLAGLLAEAFGERTSPGELKIPGA
jgi:arginase